MLRAIYITLRHYGRRTALFCFTVIWLKENKNQTKKNHPNPKKQMSKYSFLSAKSVTHTNSPWHHYISLVLLLHAQYAQVESMFQGYCWLSKNSDQEVQEAHSVSPSQRAPLQQNNLCNGPGSRPKAAAGPAWGSKQEQTTSVSGGRE